ncbi:hypothetical protein RBSWK_02218 [Rhodopirellula baltica SWK14]|uniref:Uncharacterized protein n=1 Tax=Rhodopirellula baltica SWK14 TaxID=993516 RepID=L7CKC8_RHOBT|nr:hypothetical protein RBSWK_02218 [Rhodopirellula baltica SWK14]
MSSSVDQFSTDALAHRDPLNNEPKRIPERPNGTQKLAWTPVGRSLRGDRLFP